PDRHLWPASILAVLMRPVMSGIEGLNKRRMQGLDFLQRLGMLKLKVGQAELHFKLGLDEILPGLAQLNISWFNLQRPEDRSIIVGAEDGAMVGDHHRGASILREGGKEQLQHRHEILM